MEGHPHLKWLATIFVSLLSPFSTGVTILIFVTISIFAVKLALPVSPPVAPFLGDDTPRESYWEQ